MSNPEDSGTQFPRKFGKYHLLAPLAQGGMGELYLAVTGDKGLERILCIKKVLSRVADKEYIARFRDEAKIVVQLSHGNLIPVFDAGQVAGEFFVAMEFIKGKDLRAVWNRCAQKAVAFPIDVAVYLTKELCRGLDYAHRFGGIDLVHRDVSPPNVLLSYAGEVKLTDFGLASSTLKMEKTLPGIIYGKVAYMSPEQARGETLDRRSDIYAAAIILWELLTGRQLFPPGDEQPKDLLKRAKNPIVDPPSSRAPRVPKDLDAIVLRALEPERDNRYQHASEFRDALGSWLASNAPTTDANRVERFVRKLFEEDIAREEAERVELIEQTRERVRTLPPADDLRRLLEETGVLDELVKKAERRGKGEGKNLKRRALDVGEHSDRRGEGGGRRVVDVLDHTQRGHAVHVPVPNADGSTVVPYSGKASESAAVALSPKTVDEPAEIMGQILDGRYRVERLIGEGGMGRVYLAEHVDIGKRVAVKVLHPIYSRMPDLVERFRREARAASKIGHPHIVDVTDSGTTSDGSVYFVMEYLEGVELAGVIYREGAIDVTRALEISAQICRALSAAHSVGIIHRDLKPENVFLTTRDGSDDFVKVLDFGIAKSTEAEEARTKRLTHPGMAMGTPEYMAPEQAAGKVADERCDVYAVGAILYEMLTGTPPYQGENFMEILTKKATVEPLSVRRLRGEIPPEVEALVAYAMAREAHRRPPSMDALEYELTKCVAGRGVAVARVLGISQTEQIRAASVSDVGAQVGQLGGIGDTSGGQRRIQTVADEAIAMETAPIPDVRSAGLRTFGWLVFLSLIVGGVATVFFIAKEEGQATKQALPAVSPTSSGTPHGENIPAESNVVPTGKEQPGVKAGRKKEPDTETSTPTKPTVAVAEEVPTGESAVKKPVDALPDKGHAPSQPRSQMEPAKRGIKKAERSGPARTRKEAANLLAQARGDLAAMRWSEARLKYRRVVASPFLQEAGYRGLAEVAFQTGNAPQAITYAQKAGSGTKARMVLGNAYFKNKDYKEALRIYRQVLETSPQHPEALRHAREAERRLGGR